MKRINNLLLLLFFSANVFGQSQCPKADKKLLATIKKNFSDAAKQYRFLSFQVPADSFPKTWHPDTQKYEWSNSGWWCSGFFPGSLLYIYGQQHDNALLNEAKHKLTVLEKEQHNRSTHDLGFMMYCSFGLMNKMQPSTYYQHVLMQSAQSLAARFSPQVGAIKSWDSKKGDYLVIIDNMMNLELLFWATEHSGDSSYYKIAETHAETTMKNHFRADYSSYHVLEYDPVTGVAKKKRTAQGLADESAWARGQSWGLYGYTMVYRFTHKKKYLEQAQHIADFILNNPNLPADKIPYWDYNAPDIPNALRDASAASVMAAALLELRNYVAPEQCKKYTKAAERILFTLSSPTYKADFQANGGYLLKHSVGHMPQHTEIDVPLTYADYYFLEAMNRYLSK